MCGCSWFHKCKVHYLSYSHLVSQVLFNVSNAVYSLVFLSLQSIGVISSILFHLHVVPILLFFLHQLYLGSASIGSFLNVCLRGSSHLHSVTFSPAGENFRYA